MGEDWRDRFRARFEELKSTEGLTQDKLAEIVGVSQPTIATWLSLKPGYQRTPENDDLFNRLATGIKMHPAELRYGVVPMTDEVKQREEEWRRLSPQNRAAMRAAIRALVDSADGAAGSGGDA